MARQAYAAHETLVAPARAGRAVWRLVLGLVMLAGVALGLNAALLSVLVRLAPGIWDTGAAPGLDPEGGPVPVLVLLFSFAFVTLGTMMAARLVHNRAPLGLIGPLPLAVSQFLRVTRSLLAIGAVVLLLPPYGMGLSLEQNLAPGPWLLLLPVSLTAVLVQSSAEEILFRGYIQQSLAARFSSPVIWMLLPSALFAAGHYLPVEAGENALLIAAWSGLFGILMADLTARAGTLGPAIAVHLFNNVIALLVISLPGELSGLALFVTSLPMSDTGSLRAWLYVDFAVMIVSWLAARVAIRR